MSDNVFDTWAILELMGHRRMAGYLTEVQVGGSSFIRIDLPADLPGVENTESDFGATQLYSPSAVYCITPCTEDTARKVAVLNRPAPVQRWELPAASSVDVRDAETVDDEWDRLDV